jgi:hypothetical protein
MKKLILKQLGILLAIAMIPLSVLATIYMVLALNLKVLAIFPVPVAISVAILVFLGCIVESEKERRAAK